MADETSPLSRSVEDYLKAIYSLCESRGVAGTSSIAEALEIQPASVTGMVKRLAAAGYLEHVRYRGVRLTEEGNREALRILRRHRILETYLTEALGYRWEEVHHEADRLEHAASDTLIEHMAAALEHPSHDPHGAPIPTSSGEVETTDSFTLAELAPGDHAQVRAVRDDDRADLRAAASAGLLPGTRLVVLERSLERRMLRVGLEPSEPPSPSTSGLRQSAEPSSDSAPRTREVPLTLARRIYVVAGSGSDLP